MNKSCKVIVFDLDGTLTNSKKEISLRNKRAIRRLQEQGVKVVLASGRPTYGIVPLAEELDMNIYGGYILAYNGGSIIDYGSRKLICGNFLPMNLIEPLYRATKEYDLEILTYNDSEVVTEQGENRYVALEANINKMKVREVDNFIEAIKTPVPKCLGVGDPAKILELEKILKDKYEGIMNIYHSEPFFLELVPLGIDKGESLKILLEHIGHTREDMVAFGDAYNDLTMIKLAGRGIAMSNAQDVVKEVADAVTLSNDEDGVAYYIDNYLLDT